jgi:hypothetical protein
MLNIYKSDKNIIKVLYNLCYNKDIEFISEVIKINKNIIKSNDLKSIILDIFKYAIKNNKLVIEKKDLDMKLEIIYDKSNVNDLLYIINENWDKFNDSFHADYWYCYQIVYTEDWKKELLNLGY